MKWIVAVVLVVNVVLWLLADSWQPAAVSGNSVTGSLPRVASLKSDEPVEESATSPDDPEACVQLGWVDSLKAASRLVESQPLATEVSMKVEEVERELPPLHWVIIPPQPEQVALRQFTQIQRQGIDSYLVTEGENRNAISLGLFESRQAAISVLEEKKRQNLNVVLVNFPRNQISYALSFEAEPEFAKAMARAVEVEYGKKFDFIEINTCEGVATPKKTP